MFGKKKTKGLNIIIVGCGKVGESIVDQLGSDHDITVIDTNADKIASITSDYDVMGIVGNGASFSVQKEAGVVDADLIIAVTGSDELNLLSCTVARKVAGCSAIARVDNPDYSSEIEYLASKLGLEFIINPELEVSKEMARILSLPNALEVSPFAHGRAEIVKFRIPDGNMLDGMSVAQIGSKSENVLICAVDRQKEIHIPSGDFQLQAGDIVSFVSSRKAAKEFFKLIGFKTNQVKDTIIVGGGDIGYYLARQLMLVGTKVKIIEENRLRCEELTTLLPKAIIINGDGTNQDLLQEEGLSDAESFVPLTGSDEENILLTLHANQVTHSAVKVITKINRPTFNDVINNLDLGAVIYPRYITADAIVRYVRAKNASRSTSIETISHMFNNRVEAIEFRVNDSNEITDIPLYQLKLKRNTLISFINRNGKIIIPGGQDCIKAGDTVMIVTTQFGFVDITDILEK